jgi:rfaE bifunctional protein nucleotidyltransferase chain/domain
MMEWKEYSKTKIVDPKNLESQVSYLRKTGKTIGTINGSFDLLHAGHLYILFEASKVADCLFVLLNSDASIQSYKSLDRPIIPLEYRIEMMSALAFVSFVSWFHEDDPRNILDLIKPDVHVNGAEYGEMCIEAETVKKNGGKLHLVGRIDGLSTSQIVNRIKNLS